MILVVGATGTLGRNVTRILLAGGRQVRAMTREVSKTDALKALGAKPVRGNLRDPDSLEFALRGVRAVVAAAHSMLGRGEDSSQAIDDIGHRTLIDAAKQAGVEHFVYTSVAGASLDHPVDFWRHKATVERYLRESGLAYTIIRPTAFMEMHAYQLIGKSIVNGKRVVVFGPGRNPRNYVAAEDVAKAIVGALGMPSLRGERVDIGGPENLTAHQVIEIFERTTGLKAKVLHIPLTALRTMSRIIRPVHPGVSRVIRMGVVSETTDQTFDATALRSRIPITLTRLEDWARSRIRTQAT